MSFFGSSNPTPSVQGMQLAPTLRIALPEPVTCSIDMSARKEEIMQSIKGEVALQNAQELMTVRPANKLDVSL